MTDWINRLPPRLKGLLVPKAKRETPDNLWVKCPESGQMVFYKDLEANQFVFPGSGYHERMTAVVRLKHLFDGGEFTRVTVAGVVADPLKFRDSRRYTERLKDARSDTELDDSVLVGEGTLDGRDVVAAAHDMRFVGGSLGMAAGEAIVTGMLRAVERKAPFVLFAASGGARMQEGILSLMQMPRTTIAVQRLREAKLPYIVVMTNPTTGGVTASYAMLGDIHIAEPGALICFAGPRVIQQTIREQLPDGFQRAEYLLEHGMIDMVVHRHQMRETLSRLCRVMTRSAEAKAATEKRAVVKAADVKANGAGVGAADKMRANGHAHLNGTSIEIKPGTVNGKLTEPQTGAAKGVDKGDPTRTAAAARDGAKPDAASTAKPQQPAGKTPPKDDVRG